MYIAQCQVCGGGKGGDAGYCSSKCERSGGCSSECESGGRQLGGESSCGDIVVATPFMSRRIELHLDQRGCGGERGRL